MKVTYEEPPEIKESKYPYFGEILDDEGSLVVMFTKKDTGMVVKDTSKTWDLYHHAEDWAENLFTKLDNFSVTFSVP